MHEKATTQNAKQINEALERAANHIVEARREIRFALRLIHEEQNLSFHTLEAAQGALNLVFPAVTGAEVEWWQYAAARAEADKKNKK